jgi:hypothetical protein
VEITKNRTFIDANPVIFGQLIDFLYTGKGHTNPLFYVLMYQLELEPEKIFGLINPTIGLITGNINFEGFELCDMRFNRCRFMDGNNFQQSKFTNCAIENTYFKNFDLLWRTAPSKDGTSIRISSKDDAGGRAEFSARTANQNIQNT